MTKTLKKKISRKDTHDRLTLTAQYASGGSFRLTVGRNGERLTWGGSPDREIAARQMNAMMQAIRLREGETYGTMIDRIKAIAESVDSIADLVAKL